MVFGREWAALLSLVLPISAVEFEARSAGSDGEHRSQRIEAWFAEFDRQAALDSAVFADSYARSPGSRGYDVVLDEFARSLRAAGFGASPGLHLEELRAPLDQPAWTGIAARVVLLDGGREEVLHAFAEPWDTDRAMLPCNAPPVDLVGDAVFDLEDLVPGAILVTTSHVRPDLLRRASQRGAAGVVSASLATFNSSIGADEDQEAIQVRELEGGTTLPVLQISPLAYSILRGASHPRLALYARVEYGPPVARVLVARIDGIERAGEAVALVAHLQGSGASDDASGASGLLEAARAAARLVRQSATERPSRTVCFVFGPELLQARRWIETSVAVPIAAVGVLGIGTGDGRVVLEHTPDPDRRGPVGVSPNALAHVARRALLEVFGSTDEAPGFDEQPFEGGASHGAFAEAGIPAVLLWTRPGATSRTSLDRSDRIDGEALELGALAALETAWTLADPDPAELAGCLREVSLDLVRRVGSDVVGGGNGRASEWVTWLEGAGAWLVALAR